MTPEQVKNLIEIGVESGDVHSFIVVIQGEILGSFVDVMKNIDYKEKPVMCVVACKEFMINDVVKMEQAGFPVYSTAEMAAEVLGQMYHYGVRRQSALADSIARHLTKDTLSVDNNPVRLRLINPKDIGLWTDFVNGCSEKSLWLRFLSPFSRHAGAGAAFLQPQSGRRSRRCRGDEGRRSIQVPRHRASDQKQTL